MTIPRYDQFVRRPTEADNKTAPVLVFLSSSLYDDGRAAGLLALILAGPELIALFTPIYQTLPLSQIDVIDEDKGVEGWGAE